MQATKKPHNYHKTVVWQKDDRIRKSPLKFYGYYYSELSGDRQASIITELWRLSIAFLCYFMAHEHSFEGINRPNEDGTVTELDGLAAIKYKQDLYKTSAGEVTPDKIKSALETYQSCVREYGPVEEEGLPLAVNIEKIVPIRPLLKGLSEAFADPLTGIGADLMDIDPNDIDGAYYEKCAEHLQDVM